jgi:Tfp pilus assembly PilM family ATPase
MANIFFGRGKRDHLVVEISRMGLRLLSLAMEEEKIQITNGAYFWWTYSLLESETEFQEVLEKTMRQVINQFPPKQFSVIFCVSDFHNQQRFVQTGVIEDEEELESFLLSKKYMPDSEKYLSDMTVTGNSVSELKKSQDVMIYSIPKDLAQTVMDSLEEAGYELEALEYPSNQLVSFYDYLCQEGRTAHDMVISMDWELSTVSFFYEGELRFSHFLSYRLYDLVDVLVKKAQLDEKQAISIVKDKFFPALFKEAEASEISQEILEHAGEELACFMDELLRTVAFYCCRTMEFKMEQVGRIIFCGLERNIEPLKNYICESFVGIPHSSIDVWEYVSMSDELKARFDKEDWYEPLRSTVGLGMRYLE